MADLTKAQKDALRWIAANEPVRNWPPKGSVSSMTRKRLHEAGLIETKSTIKYMPMATSLTEKGWKVRREIGNVF